MATESESWLAGLKVGDEVAVPLGWNGFNIVPVTHATRTQLFAGHAKWRRKDGYRMGSGSGKLWPVTDEIREGIRRREAIRDLLDAAERRKIEALPTDRIEAALALLSPPQETE